MVMAAISGHGALPWISNAIGSYGVPSPFPGSIPRGPYRSHHTQQENSGLGGKVIFSAGARCTDCAAAAR